MFIKRITIEGVDGEVEVMHLDGGGALATSGGRVLCELRREDDREARYAKALEVAKVVCGTVRHATRWGDKAGDPNATNSMIHDVLNELERVAGV